MAIEHLQPGIVTHSPLGSALGESATTTLANAASFELIRMVLPTGKEIPPHKTRGEITVQCLEGQVIFSCYGETRDLRPGDLLYLPAAEDWPPYGGLCLERHNLARCVVTDLLVPFGPSWRRWSTTRQYYDRC